jgi:hypothetical protein
MGSRRCVATAGALAILVVMAGAVPAQATVFDSGHFTFEESVNEDLCGIAVHRDTVASGHFRTRTGKGDLDQAFFGQSASSSPTPSPTSRPRRRFRSRAGSRAWT